MISRDDVRGAITPLRLVFWGGLLCVFDLTFASTTNGRGIRFDLLNDALGMILISVGVCRLASVRVSDRYRTAMLFVVVVSFLATIEAFFNHLVFPRPALLSLMASLFAMACLAAIVVFCVAMLWFCREAGTRAAGDSWKLTTWLFVLIYARWASSTRQRPARCSAAGASTSTWDRWDCCCCRSSRCRWCTCSCPLRECAGGPRSGAATSARKSCRLASTWSPRGTSGPERGGT